MGTLLVESLLLFTVLNGMVNLETSPTEADTAETSSLFTSSIRLEVGNRFLFLFEFSRLKTDCLEVLLVAELLSVVGLELFSSLGLEAETLFGEDRLLDNVDADAWEDAEK